VWNYSAKFYFARPQGMILVSLFSNALFGSDSELGSVELDLSSLVLEIENLEKEEEFPIQSDPSITVHPV
jgi:hypothetical protein